MNLYRLRNRLPHISFQAVDAALMQLKPYRAICGGIYVRMASRWYRALALQTLGDGSRILRRCDKAGGSFHETFNGIQRLEDRT